MASPRSSWVAPRTLSNIAACRAFCSAIFRWVMRRAALKTPSHRRLHWNWRCGSSNRHPRRAPLSSRRCAGAQTRGGSSIIRISSAFRQRKSGADEKISTGKRRSPRGSATTPRQRTDIPSSSGARHTDEILTQAATRPARSKPCGHNGLCKPASRCPQSKQLGQILSSCCGQSSVTNLKRGRTGSAQT
jgi:hypothetical protein